MAAVDRELTALTASVQHIAARRHRPPALTTAADQVLTDLQTLTTSNGQQRPLRSVPGHLSTTEIYARASTEAKRKALEAAYTDITSDDLSEWNQDPGLLDWLTNL